MGLIFSKTNHPSQLVQMSHDPQWALLCSAINQTSPYAVSCSAIYVISNVHYFPVAHRPLHFAPLRYCRGDITVFSGIMPCCEGFSEFLPSKTWIASQQAVCLKFAEVLASRNVSDCGMLGVMPSASPARCYPFGFDHGKIVLVCYMR